MAAPDADFWKTIKEYWEQIAAIVLFGAWGVKMNLTVRRLKKAFFDERGLPNCQSIDGCIAQIARCSQQRNEYNSERIRELQNIHDAISNTKAEVSELKTLIIQMQDKKHNVRGSYDPHERSA